MVKRGSVARYGAALRVMCVARLLRCAQARKEEMRVWRRACVFSCVVFAGASARRY